MCRRKVHFEHCGCGVFSRTHGRICLPEVTTQAIFTVEQALTQFQEAVSKGLEDEDNWMQWYSILPPKLPQKNSEITEADFYKHLSHSDLDPAPVAELEETLKFLTSKMLTEQWALAISIGPNMFLIIDLEFDVNQNTGIESP